METEGVEKGGVTYIYDYRSVTCYNGSHLVEGFRERQAKAAGSGDPKLQVISGVMENIALNVGLPLLDK